MSFTPHQRRALETDHHVAVTANAGSGKTRVLVERYFHLVAAGAPLSEVLALTYTEKAAGELKRKIAGRINAALGESGGDYPRERLEEIRNGFAAAFIGTIHSFCARLLREYPVEAGVDASFSVMEEIDSGAMIGESVNDALAAVMAGEMGGGAKDDLLFLVRSLGKVKTRNFLSLLVRRRDLRGRMERTAYAGDDDGVLARWQEELERSLEGAMADTDLLADMGKVIGASSGKDRPAVEEAFSRVRSPGACRARAAAFLRVAEGMWTKDGSLRRTLVSKDEGADPGVAAAALRLKGRMAEAMPVAEFLASGAPSGAHRPLLRAGRTLLALAEAGTLRYGKRKEEEGRLDFEDLQLVMRGLLSDDVVRAQLRRRFRYVMVDEFQDTNALQLDILLPLLDRLREGNLFIVGDPKQSIYRFREADVRVFRRTTLEITGIAGERGDVKLGESFRPLRDIAAFVNLLFAPLMTEEGGYEPLVVARPNNAPGTVELLLADPAADGGLAEEELVVRRVLGLVREGATVFDPAETPRAVRFGDIALLLRNRNALPRFEEALIRAGVPYAVSGGVGYFQTQDVYDTYNYLRFLVDAGDDVALAGILRSPYFNVSDADLYRLPERHGGETLWSALAGAGVLRAASGPLARAYRILEEDRAALVRLPVPELLVRVIGRSLLPGALAGTPRGAQAMANLEKLIAMARQFEGQGFNGLYDFVARLRHLMDEEEREGQATIDSRADAVRVMTVHASKGLEFPVVVVPRLQAPFGRDREPYIDEDLGLGFRLAEGELPPVARHMRNRERGKQREEEQRVFYVACTRARDILILSAEEGRADAGESWLAWVHSALGEGGVEGERIVRPVESVRYDPAGGGVCVEAHVLSIPVLRSLPPVPPPDASPSAIPEGRRVDLGRPVSQPHGEIFSASKVRTYLECPAKYYFRYVLGYPLGTGPFAGGDEEEMGDHDYPAELRGRIFHAVMEQADVLDLSSSSVEDAVSGVLARHVPGIRGEALADDVAGLVRGVLSSEAWGEVARGTDVRTEFSISAALGGEFITGTIDRLYRDGEGVLTIVDYKTDAVTVAEAGARAELYWPQLAFYGVMVQRLHDAGRIRARILFAAHPEFRSAKEFDPSMLRSAAEEISSVIGNIRDRNFPGRLPACRGCPLAPEKCLIGK